MSSAFPLRIVTWNVRYFSNRAAGFFSTEAGVGEVAQALVGLGPDVVCLQEVEQDSLRAGKKGRSQTELLVEALSAGGWCPQVFYWPAHRYEVAGVAFYTTGLLMLVRSGLVCGDHEGFDITHRRFSLVGGLKQTRVVQAIRLGLGDRSLVVANTHLSLPAFLTRDLPRLRDRMGYGENQVIEARNVQTFLAGYCRPQEPCVVVGDFNSVPGSPAYQSFLSVGFEDAFAPFGSPGWCTQGLSGKTLHLDHVFSKGVVWGDFEGSHMWGGGQFDGISDHVPKIGRIQACQSQ